MYYPRSILLVALLAILTSQGAAQTPTFLLTPSYSGGTGIAVADFNRDGNPDVATSDDVLTGFGAVLFGNGNGTFRFGTNLGVNGGIATADFNGDGIPDILFVTNNSTDSVGSLVVLLGKGDGTFQSPIITNAGAVLAQVGFAVADVNGDGKPDVIAEVQGGYGLFVYLGNGDGTFTPVAPNLSIQTTSIVTGDFNGDNRVDIAFPAANGACGVAFGNGDGTFQTPIITPNLYPLYAVDFNNDGKLDLVGGTTYNGSPAVGIFLGNGNGTFQSPIDIIPAYYEAAATADLNGDDQLDLVLMDAGYARIFLGDSSGGLTEKSDYAGGGGPFVIADFNNDRKLDIVNTRSVLIGNGDGTFQGQPAVPTHDASPDSNTTLNEGGAVTADFNNDGKPDLAVVGANVSILLNQGNGLTSVTYSYPLPSEYTANRTSLAAADLRGIGIVDLLIGVTNPDNQTSSLLVMLGNGDGTFAAPTTISLGTGTGPILAIGDFNGDKKPDVALVFSGICYCGGSSYMTVLLGNGDGTFGSPKSYYAGLSETWLALGDFNDDGNLDAAVTGSAGVAILLGNGDGTFKYPTFSGTNSFVYVMTADLRGDGKTDLITQFPTGSGVGGGQLSAQVLLGNGDGTFQSLTPFGVENGLYFGYGSTMATADLTGDGKLDLIVGEPSPYLEVFPGNGDGTFGSAVNFPLSQSYVNPVVADFNLDGKPDVAVGTNSGWVLLFYNTTQPDFKISAAALSPPIVTPGQSATSTVTVTPLNGFDSAVTLSCSGLPSGAGCTFNPATVPKGSATSTLTITISTATAVGTYAVTVTGTSGALVHSTAVSLVVQDFTISAAAFSPASISPGGSATSNITIEQKGGFNQTVTLSCSSITLNGSSATMAPPSCSFNPASISDGGGFSTLTVSTTGSGASLAKPWLRPSGLFYALWLLMLGTALLGGFGSRKKKVGFLLVLLALSGLMFLSACGGGGGNNSGGGGSGGTRAGTYTITITGTAGSTVHSTTVTLTVQ
ncbi:MAG TPA: VCBS repeat-containing protein [Terriglobales bacterium]|nr:VCBS repeat-containing protein [Terriglobales bacterium]